jgi:hypothetical protein
MIGSRILCAAFVLMLAISSAASAAPFIATFNFDASAPFGPAPSNLTNGGVTASFGSADGLGVFTILPAFFFVSPMSGNVLGDVDPNVLHPLSIQFDRVLSGLALDFALDPLGGAAAVLTVEAFLGANLVGSSSATATLPLFAFSPQGTLSFGALAFDSIRVTSTRENFAIDNVSVAVPEPATLLLLAAGLLGSAAFRRRLVS